MKKIICLLAVAALLLGAACAGEGGAPPFDARTLTSFEYCRGGYMWPVTHALYREGDACFLRVNDDPPRQVDESLADEILEIIDVCGMLSWDGFHESRSGVLDGETFWLEIVLSDGETASASGDNAFPENYFEAIDRVEEAFEEERMAWLAGVYRYEGEGFGGDFTLTLDADGTYTFYEGPLSSYLGGGTWYADVYGLSLTETNGLELFNMFSFSEGELRFYERGSDNFPCVKVPDGGRFVRLTEADAEAVIRLTNARVKGMGGAV